MVFKIKKEVDNPGTRLNKANKAKREAEDPPLPELDDMDEELKKIEDGVAEQKAILERKYAKVEAQQKEMTGPYIIKETPTNVEYSFYNNDTGEELTLMNAILKLLNSLGE